MAVEADVIYKDRAQIVDDMLADLLARIPDAWTREDGNLRLFMEVWAGGAEGVFLANELLRDNIFVQRANLPELRLHGEQWGLDIKAGTYATGTLRFSGAGGVFIPTGAVAASDPGAGEVIYFVTTEDGTIPNPGDPTAPTIADNGAGVMVAGLYEYVVTFLTPEGETMAGIESAALNQAINRKINVTNIPIGGPGTTGRRVYRQRDGGGYQLVTTIADNVTVVYADNNADGVLGAAPPAASTAERVSIDAQGEEPGTDYNVALGSVNQVADAPEGVTDVTNTTTFTGGSDEEDMENYRGRLLEWIRNPHTGSPADLIAWALEIDGVEEAAVFQNDNLGVATNGHNTIRISGPDGSIPSAGVVAAVLAHINEQDVANITNHVDTFTAVPTNVTVVVTLETGHLLADVTPGVQEAITNYINKRPVGQPVYNGGIIDAVFNDVVGVATLVVTVPATEASATTATQKRTAGVITVT